MEESLDWGLGTGESHSWTPRGPHTEAPGGRLILIVRKEYLCASCLLLRAAPEVSVAQMTETLNSISALL